ncbi:bactofilin family protein [Desulfoplanes sp.]
MARDQINAFLGAGTKYEGKLDFQGSVRIDGDFHGEIESEGTLVVGKDARIEGVFRIGELILSGTMHGQVTASKKIVLNKQSHFTGTLKTPIFVVEEGADLQGRVNLDNAGQEPETPEECCGAVPNLEQEGVISIANT